MELISDFGIELHKKKREEKLEIVTFGYIRKFIETKYDLIVPIPLKHICKKYLSDNIKKHNNASSDECQIIFFPACGGICIGGAKVPKFIHYPNNDLNFNL